MTRLPIQSLRSFGTAAIVGQFQFTLVYGASIASGLEMMKQFYKGCLLTLVLFVLAVAAVKIAWRLQPNEIMSHLVSPNGKWHISEEFDPRTSCFRIVLRDSAGKEIARSEDRLVKPYLIDLPSDHRSNLEITDDAAGEEGHPLWYLDTVRNQWHAAPSDAPVKSHVTPSR